MFAQQGAKGPTDADDARLVGCFGRNKGPTDADDARPAKGPTDADDALLVGFSRPTRGQLMPMMLSLSGSSGPQGAN